METREERARLIADRFRIVESGGKWIVPSQHSLKKKYAVRIVGSSGDCTCPDFEARRRDCKHIMAVRSVIERRYNPDGSVTFTDTMAVSKRTTYRQRWPAYNAAQVNEKDRFQVLLRNLCETVPTPPQIGRGQRRLLLSDAIFSAAFKVYSTVSGRRFMSDLREAHERGFIAKVPHYNSIFNYLEKPELRHILTGLIEMSALPLRSIETDFALDSSGFSTSKFERWFDHKWGAERFRHQWIKVHLMCGTTTNVVTAVEIGNAHDAAMLPPLLDTTLDGGFDVAEVSADKGYLSYNNVYRITRAGASPYIALKKNSTMSNPRAEERHGWPATAAWRSMYHYFQYRRDEFLAHYHRRSNVETVFSQIKRKFGDSLRSKSETAMVNEALCKVLCHNLTTLIHEMFELGIDPDFCPTGGAVAQRESGI